MSDFHRTTSSDDEGEGGTWLHEGPDLAEMLAALIRHRRVAFGVPALFAVVAILWSLLSPPAFTASASFLPKAADQQMSQIALLASRFGIAGQEGGRQSSAVYAYLLESDAMLLDIVQDTFSTAGEEPEHGTLVEIFDAEAATPSARRLRAIRSLKGSMEIQAGEPPGGVQFTVTTGDSLLSYQIATRLLAKLNEINLASRQGQASEERQFIEQQIQAARGEVAEAETRLQQFLEQNRRYTEASPARFQEDRLTRDLMLRRSRLVSLLEVYDQVRIREIRNAPLLDVVEEPYVPLAPDPSGLVMNTLVAIILGTLLAIALIVALELWRRLRPALRAAAGSGDIPRTASPLKTREPERVEV